MTSYIAAVDSTISVMKNLSKQDMYKVSVGPVSLRFSASSSTNLSMAYSVNSSQSLGRNYIEILSLIPFYKSIQTYYDIVTAISEQTISKCKVGNSFDRLSVCVLSLLTLSRVGGTGVKSRPLHLQHISTNLILITLRVLHCTKLLQRNMILVI